MYDSDFLCVVFIFQRTGKKVSLKATKQIGQILPDRLESNVFSVAIC